MVYRQAYLGGREAKLFESLHVVPVPFESGMTASDAVISPHGAQPVDIFPGDFLFPSQQMGVEFNFGP